MRKEWTCCQWLSSYSVEQDSSWQWQLCTSTRKLLRSFQVRKHWLKEFGGVVTQQKSKVVFSYKRGPPNLSFYDPIAYLACSEMWSTALMTLPYSYWCGVCSLHGWGHYYNLHGRQWNQWHREYSVHVSPAQHYWQNSPVHLEKTANSITMYTFIYYNAILIIIFLTFIYCSYICTVSCSISIIKFTFWAHSYSFEFFYPLPFKVTGSLGWWSETRHNRINLLQACSVVPHPRFPHVTPSFSTCHTLVWGQSWC